MYNCKAHLTALILETGNTIFKLFSQLNCVYSNTFYCYFRSHFQSNKKWNKIVQFANNWLHFVTKTMGFWTIKRTNLLQVKTCSMRSYHVQSSMVWWSSLRISLLKLHYTVVIKQNGCYCLAGGHPGPRTIASDRLLKGGALMSLLGRQPLYLVPIHTLFRCETAFPFFFLNIVLDFGCSSM